ncbi:Arm DNA-binding domain-containing protein [Paraburkholderia acidipaludis]|uniref:Arm DNA-binding domain-containing protein n=1 Tax=Paraburkholderia acidipaludis TaxID=660537 RepID=UPI0004889555|nr:Arm DNA-binding domain-containing protein [Paraburkholderia acidipaludis]
MVFADKPTKALKAGDKPVLDGKVTGGRCPPPGGSKWTLRVTGPVTGKRRDAGLGVYPEVSIADAGDKALDAITPADCADVLRPIWLEKVETASRTRQRMHAVMQWAWAHGQAIPPP